MQKALTNKTLEALKPQAKRYEVHDLHCPGMSVRVSAQGQKVFSVKFRYGLDQKRMKLGVFPRITSAMRGPDQDEREVAKDYLLDALANGPKAAAELKSQGEARAISASTLDRARKELGIVTAKQGKIWFWSLPPE